MLTVQNASPTSSYQFGQANNQMARKRLSYMQTGLPWKIVV